MSEPLERIADALEKLLPQQDAVDRERIWIAQFLDREAIKAGDGGSPRALTCIAECGRIVSARIGTPAPTEGGGE